MIQSSSPDPQASFSAASYPFKAFDIASDTDAMERDEFVQKVMPLLQAARAYHRHSVVGMEHIPDDGRALIVVNHSLATYDIMLLLTAIQAEKNRQPRPLIDRLFFKVPYLGELATLYGAVEGNQKGAEDLLNSDELVTVAPGGMREALRPSTQRYQIRWNRRTGFVKLAMRTRAPLILAACPKADDLYDVYPSHVTAWIYRTFKVPVFFARGLGPTPIPRPIQLTHFLSEPLMPPPSTGDDDQDELIAREFHKDLMTRMRGLISDAIHHE
jgi:1-acyl-sn-glycerol-3-phosphate acyltransferase